jgi:hypothetical protein
MHTVTFTTTHCLSNNKAITRQLDQTTTKKDKEKSFSNAKSAYKEMKA